MADRLSVRATGPPDSVKRLDLRLQRPLLRETLKMAEPPRQGLLAVSMRQPQATPFELLQASLPVKTKQQKTPDWPPSPRLRCPTRPPLFVRGTCAAGGRRTFLFLWCARADVREVLAHAHLPK